MTQASSDQPKTIPSATVVIFRNCPTGGPPELLMVQRAREMRFAGGAAVFPGGRVDPEDYTLAARLLPDADPEVAAAKIAGVRETLEETGLVIALQGPVSAGLAAEARALLLEQGALAPLLDHFGWSLDLESLVPFARWSPQQDGSFDTRFFLANLSTGAVDIAVDATENTRLFWASAAAVLGMADAGEAQIIYPTRRNLERLALYATFEQACTHAREFPVGLISPYIEMVDGHKWLRIPDGHGYPVTGQPLEQVRRG